MLPNWGPESDLVTILRLATKLVINIRPFANLATEKRLVHQTFFGLANHFCYRKLVLVAELVPKRVSVTYCGKFGDRIGRRIRAR